LSADKVFGEFEEVRAHRFWCPFKYNENFRGSTFTTFDGKLVMI
jgi:hypothetical protein